VRSYNAAVQRDQSASLSTQLRARISTDIAAAGGWLPFDRFMALALYTPGLGYYASDSRQFGRFPGSGSDFVTAPELSPLFGRALAAQVQQALDVSGSAQVWEFGAGSGALAAQLLQALAPRIERYAIVDLSGTLRQQQAERLRPWAGQVEWLDAWPTSMHGVVVGNEVLDAMPVQLLHWDGQAWFERGVVVDDEGFAWGDRPTALRPPIEATAFVPGTVTEIHPQAEAFVRTLAERLQRGAAFFLDYGFPEHEYYHPQRVQGTLMCHRAHRVDSDPLADVGLKDITAHVNFSGVALAGQAAGLDVLGYSSQARFLLNCGLPALLLEADVRTRADAQKLIHEHEMGELFKVIGFARGMAFEALGFQAGDRSHTL
jgi:SAM-dependent MidA family methyltransferase